MTSVSRLAPARSRLWLLAAVLLVAVYSLARYGDAVGDFYFLDDFWLLHAASRIAAGPPLAFFEIFQPTHAGFILYRPFTQTGYFWLLVSLFGLDSGAAHALQIAVFACNAVLVLLIATRQLASPLAGLCVALLYAAAPGHGAAVYWLAAYSMTGAALALFLLLWWWGRSSGRARLLGCTLLQVVALLCGEYGVAGVGLLVALACFGARREPWQRVARDLSGALLVVLAYATAKLGSFVVRGPASFGYGVTADPLVIVTNLGHYATATLNVLTFQLGAGAYAPVGFLVLGLAGLSIGLAWSGFAAWRPVALGTTLFVLGVGPVLSLANHYFDFFIGVAALGAAITCVGVARLVARGRDWLALVMTLVVLGIDARTADAAMRQNGVAVLVRNAARSGEALLTRLERLSKTLPQDAVFVMPKRGVMVSVFEQGNAQEVFFRPPLRVRLYDPLVGPRTADGDVVLSAPPPPSEEATAPTFRRDARYDWLRRGLSGLHQRYAQLQAALAR